MFVDSSTGNKRKAIEETEHLSHKKSRSRVCFSCTECHRRKQKCDKQVPCSHCVARKIPGLCKPYTPGKSDIDFQARLTRLERIVETALPQYADLNMPTDYREASGSPEEHCKASCYDREGQQSFRNVVQSPFIQQLQHSSVLSVLEGARSPGACIRSLVLENGFSSNVLSDLIEQLPDATLSHTLVDYYFTSINYSRHPLCEPLFRASYQSICLNGDNLRPSDICFLPLLFTVLAISMRLAPDDIGGDDQMRRLTSLRFYWSSRRALLIASAVQTNSLEVILARLLGGRFNIFDRRITESWCEIGAAIRMAHALGLHRDPSNLDLDDFQVEYRRRIWAYVYHADRAYAFIIGRPQSISDDYTSTRAPLNVDDASLQSRSRPLTPHPPSNPTIITFTILRHALAGIIGRIAHHYHKVQGQDPYSNVLALEEELKLFIASLPPCYDLTNPDMSFDEARPYVPMHRFLLLTEIMFYRIGLHRPYFMREIEKDTFNLSRQACIESAKHDSRIRQNFYKTASRQVIDASGGMFRAFQSTMICGIALIIDPNREDAQEMHAILDNFLHTTSETAGREIDVGTLPELKIIEFLRSKVVEASGSASTNTTEAGEPVLPGSESGSQPSGFPQTATHQPTISPSHSDNQGQGPSQPPFLSPLTSTNVSPRSFPLDEAGQPWIQLCPGGDTGIELNSGFDVLGMPVNHDGLPEGQMCQANEQWAGGSGIVPDIMVTSLNSNGDNRVVDGTAGEWSYWEALVNRIRVGGQT